MKETIGDLVYERDALPCPFCGCKDILRMHMRFEDSTEENMFHEDGTMRWSYLKCWRCGISTEAYCYEHSSLEQWNRRAGSEELGLYKTALKKSAEFISETSGTCPIFYDADADQEEDIGTGMGDILNEMLTFTDDSLANDNSATAASTEVSNGCWEEYFIGQAKEEMGDKNGK